jgi:hypothetical protein
VRLRHAKAHDIASSISHTSSRNKHGTVHLWDSTLQRGPVQRPAELQRDDECRLISGHVAWLLVRLNLTNEFSVTLGLVCINKTIRSFYNIAVLLRSGYVSYWQVSNFVLTAQGFRTIVFIDDCNNA